MSKKYQIFMIDPPWLKQKGGIRKCRPKQGSELEYATMPTKSIFELLDKKIFIMADQRHAVFLWMIEDFLIDAELYMNRRFYKRHCRFVWDKTNGIAPAFTVRYSHEYLIWYYKEKMLPIASDCRGKFRTVFSERARQHSRKPDFAYQMIESLYPDFSKIDVFSREKRPNWDQFGNQIDYW